jgi:hypothetical protein
MNVPLFADEVVFEAAPTTKTGIVLLLFMVGSDVK